MSEPEKKEERTPPGLHTRRLSHSALERAFVEKWAEMHSRTDFFTTLMSVPADLTNDYRDLPLGEVTARDRVIAATIIQWLGTGVGQGFIYNAQQAHDREIEKQKVKT